MSPGPGGWRLRERIAGRALALTVGASYDTPPSFPDRLAAVQLFAATDLRTFVLELGGNDRGGPADPPRIR